MGAKSRIPRGFRSTVEIRHVPWRVTYHEAITDTDGGELLGQCHADWHQIQISLSQCRDRMINTLIHECMHAYLRDAPGFSDAAAGEEFATGERLEEGTVTAAVAGVVLAILRANPWIDRLRS